MDRTYRGRTTELRSHEDFKAFLEFVWIDNYFPWALTNGSTDTDVQFWHLEKLVTWPGADMYRAAQLTPSTTLETKPLINNYLTINGQVTTVVYRPRYGHMVCAGKENFRNHRTPLFAARNSAMRLGS